jgi:putative zinc finger protein
MNTNGPSRFWRRSIVAIRQWTVTRRGSRGRRPFQCQEMVQLVTDYLDGALDDSKRRRFESHLRKCEGCTAYVNQLRLTMALVGEIRDEHLDTVFRERLLEAFADTTGSW